MPVEYLTAEQEARYGHFTGDPSEAELAQYFYLDARDWDLLGGRRSDHNRLGLVVQLTSVRYLGTVPDDLSEIPAPVVSYLARQLRLEAGNWVERYEQSKMRLLHLAEIRATYGYYDFSEAGATFPLVRFLYARAWLSAERPGLLFDAAVTWLKTHQVLLPGITVLERLVARVRDRVAERVWQRLARALIAEQQATLETLLFASGPDAPTGLDRLRRAPTRYSAPALVAVLERLEEIRALGVGHLDLSSIPPSRLKVLANFALTAKVQTLRRMRPDRRAATLLAVTRALEMSAHDDALDCFWH